MFHAQGPSRIIFVRHGQREDHADPNWHLTASRPHDSPLTQVGKQAAFELGRYLGEAGVVPSYNVSSTESSTQQPLEAQSDGSEDKVNRIPMGVKRQRDTDAPNNAAQTLVAECNNIVVLSSPLVRAVQTAHHLICGIMAAARHRERKHMIDTLKNTEEIAEESAGTQTPSASQVDPTVYVPSVEGFLDAVQPHTILFEHNGHLSHPVHLPNSTITTDSHIPKSIPLYIEPGVMECAYWINYDIGKARDVRARSGVTEPILPLVAAGSKWLGRLANSADVVSDVPTNPIFMPPAYHKSFVSEFVKLTPFPVAEDSCGLFGFSEVEYTFDVDSGKVVEMDVGGTNGSPCRRGNDTQLRCYNTAAAIANCAALHDKIVIVVGHGQTMRDASQKLVPKIFMADRPKYTAFTDTVRSNATSQFSSPLATSPAGPTVDSPSTPTVASFPKFSVPAGGQSPTCSFTLRDGSEAFGVPHLPLSLLREY